MKVDAWMPLHIGPYLADTTDLSRDQHGGYLLLLMAGWRKGGELPDRDEALANIVKASPSEWKKLRPVLAKFFDIRDGVWRQKRQAAEMDKAKENRKKSEAKASRAATVRWEKERAKHAASNAPSIASGNAQAMLEQCPLPIPTATPNPKAKTLESKTLSDSPKNPAKSDGVRKAENTELRQQATEVLDMLNTKTGKHFRPTLPNLGPIMARLKEHSLREVRAVVAIKCREWIGGDMEKHLTPETLFRASKFEKYVGSVPPETMDEASNGNLPGMR